MFFRKEIFAALTAWESGLGPVRAARKAPPSALWWKANTFEERKVRGEESMSTAVGLRAWRGKGSRRS